MPRIAWRLDRARLVEGRCDGEANGESQCEQRRSEQAPIKEKCILRRVECPRCGIVVEKLPWASGKNQQTHSYRLFLSRWAKRMSWQEVAAVFGTSWDSVYRAVRWVVHRGIVHQDLTNIRSIGVDEIQYRRGHKYLTLVYQLDNGAKRLLYVARDRTEASLDGFFNILSQSTIDGIQFACTDMLPAYLKVLKERASNALNILDRFHIMRSEPVPPIRRSQSP